MQSPQDPSQTNKQIFNQPRSRIIAIAVLMLVVGIFLIGVISGSGSSDCWFSLFCSNNAINPPSPDVPGLILGTAATIVLVTVINAPLAVSVGVGIVIWLAVRSFL